MRRVGVLYVVSFGVHVAAGVSLGYVRKAETRQATAISISESPKPKPPPKDDTPPPEPPKEPVVRERTAARAKAAAADPKEDAVREPSPAKASAAPALDGMPDFGVALSGGIGSAGLAIPGGPGGARLAASAGPLRRTQVLAPKAAAAADPCEEAVVKPKANNVPRPTTTKAAQAAAIQGKVRVEITVDERGRVKSVRILQGLGYGLDEVALEAARQVTFAGPATHCGKPVNTTFNIGMLF